eukprot:12410388-Karenia_brevis.AAC.1
METGKNDQGEALSYQLHLDTELQLDDPASFTELENKSFGCASKRSDTLNNYIFQNIHGSP